MWKTLPVVMGQPAVSVSYLADQLLVSKPAAQTAIDHMVEAAVLTPVNDYRRNRVWAAAVVISALDQFAEPAGRRRRSSC